MTTAVLDAPTTAKKTAAGAKLTLTLPLKALQRAMQTVAPAVERKSTIPILGNVKIAPEDGAVEFTATNLDLSIRARVQAAGVVADDAFLLPALKLDSYAKLLDGEAVSLSLAETRATLRCGRSLTKLPVMPLANFPAVSREPGGQGMELAQEVAERMLRFVSFAVSTEESRYTLNGALLETDGTHLRLVATDGHRLAVYTVAAPPASEVSTVILPGGFLRALDKAMGGEGGVALRISEDSVFASTADPSGSVQLQHKRISGQFPNWKAVVPKDNAIELRVSAPVMAAALRRALSFADERSGAVKLHVAADSIKLHCASVDTGETDETVDVTSAAPFESFAIGFNGAYLLDAFARLDGEVSLRFKDGNSSALLSAVPEAGECFQYVVMPMRV